MSAATSPTAAVLIIGDEILFGRTKDTNLNTLARFLTALGIDLKEARTVGDTPGQIIDAVRTLSAGHDYLFTTGGIGPTHDDITADCVAEAMDVALPENPDALAIGLAWDVQELPALPVEAHDRPLAAVVTPQRMFGPFGLVGAR